MPQELKFRILGPLEVARGTESIVIRRARLRGLLGCLLLGVGETFSIPRLVDAVWGPGAPASADGLVRVYVSQLRQLLGNEAVLTKPGGYAIADPGDRLDAERFRRLVSEAAVRRSEGDDEGAAVFLGEALALWSGDVLADTPIAGDAAATALQLSELRLQALEEHSATQIRLGHPQNVVADLEREAAANPTRERLIEQLLVALYQSGRQADALALYADVRKRLVEELGLEPGPALQELQSQMLRHDPALAAPTVRDPSPAARPRHRFVLAAVLAALAIGASLVGWILTRPATAPAVGNDAVVRIDSAQGRITRVAEPGGAQGVTLLTDQGVWVVDASHRTLEKLDPETLAVTRRVPLRALPHALIDAGRGLWLANSFNGTISRLNPAGRIGPSVRPEPHAAGRLALAYGAGALWIGSQDGRLTRFDPHKVRALTVVRGLRMPQSLAIADGSVWVAQATSVSIARVNTRSGRVMTPLPIGGVPATIVSAAGSVWALAPAQGRLWQIDPRRNTVVGSVSVPGASLLAGSASTLWLANGTDGTVTRLLPRPAITIALRKPIASLAAGPTEAIATTK